MDGEAPPCPLSDEAGGGLGRGTRLTAAAFLFYLQGVASLSINLVYSIDDEDEKWNCLITYYR